MKPIIDKPPIGTVISTVIADKTLPASVCVHSLALRPMCTIIPVEKEPNWILSIWGNGPGIVCFLVDWDGKLFYDVEITAHSMTPIDKILNAVEWHEIITQESVANHDLNLPYATHEGQFEIAIK